MEEEIKTVQQNIGCINCGTKVGEVALKLTEDYKGDNYYGFLCNLCVDIINK